MNNQTTIQFIREHAADDVRMLALHKNKYSEVDIDFALQQIEGRQRTKDKLPEIYQIEDWHYPIRLSLEQCSSETTAKYKASVLQNFLTSQLPNLQTLVDLTGGFGIDTFYLSEQFQDTHYVERNADLCEIAKHNFSLIDRNIIVHNAQAEEFLQTAECLMANGERRTAIYLDPARRSASGGKVFRLQDCEPDLTQLYPTLISKCRVLMVKLSPMLDITEALRSLPDAREVHIVAVKNEVKEILIVCHPVETRDSHVSPQEPKRIAVNLESNDAPFVFTEEEESAALIISPMGETREGLFLYEPNAAILKAGAFKTVGTRYGLRKLAINTHLYASDRLIEDFPGRIFKVLGTPDKAQLKVLQKTGAHTICRNYPLSADKLAAKHKIKEGGTLYLIGTRISEKNTLLLAERVR